MQLVDYTRVLRRRWWLILLVTLIGLVASVGYYKVAHKVYTATASVYVTATSQTANQVTGGRTSGTVNLDTEAQVVQSVTVAAAAAKLMHSTETPQQLTNRVSVTVPANSQVLAIACQAASADKAAICAQSFAQAYLTYSSASTTAETNSQITALQKQIGTLQSASAKLATEIDSLPDNSSQRASAEEQLSSDHSQLSSLNGQVANLTAELADPSGGSIISNANPPAKPTSPKLLLIVPSGLLAGLLIGLLLAFLVDRRDRRIRRPHDISKLNVPVLMSLPLRKFRPELAVAVPRSPTGRDFAELAHVLTGTLGTGNHVILVTGSSPGQGTSLVAANLAVALSRNQPNVTLVCADLEGSAIPAMTGLRSSPGLTDVLDRGTKVSKVVRHPAAAVRLSVIAPGSTAGPQSEDLQQDAVEQLLSELSSDSRWVVVEGPSVQSGPDAYTLAQAADAAILVTEVPRTRSDQVVDSIQHLDKIGVSVLGTVLLPSPKAPPQDDVTVTVANTRVRRLLTVANTRVRRVLPATAAPAHEPASDEAAADDAVTTSRNTAANGHANGHQAAQAASAARDTTDGDETTVINVQDAWSTPEETPSSLPRG
ncbi:MAG: Wzz/FepE/Etk N-terminal domain-containing protein [Streptosporangiaceae bacterium]